MKQRVVLAVGTALLAAWGLAPAVRAQEKQEETEDLKKVEKRIVVRQGGGGFLGVVLEELTGDARGAKVRVVEPESAAAKAGIEQGDVIVRFDGEAVRTVAQLARLVRETPPGRSVPIEILRGGATQKLTVTLGQGDRLLRSGEALPGQDKLRLELAEPPAIAASPNAPLQPRDRMFRLDSDLLSRLMPRRLGIEFIEMGEQLAAHYKLGDESGVLVASVDEDSPAAKAGLVAGDVILELGGQKIRRGRELREAVAKAPAGKELVLKVQRDGRPLELKVTIEKRVRERLEQAISL